MRVRALIAAGVALAFAGALAGAAQAQQGFRMPATAPGATVGFAGAESAWTPKVAARQLKLFSQAVDALAPQRPGVRDVYILSAGLWGDPVFEREAVAAAKILEARYGAQGRTLILSNGGDETTNPLPAASPDFIQAGLARIAERMDPAEDVFVLFLTSHGDTKGISVFEAGRMEGVLSPVGLRMSLDDAGMRNRVVILSACHSGVFVPALQTDTSVVITAASRDKKSFGCEPENDWTYFGDAFFNLSLKRGRTLAQAFGEASAQIALWEQRDRLPASEPQMFAGAGAAAFLSVIEAPKTVR